MLAVLLCLTWASHATLRQNIAQINETIRSLNERQWRQLFDSLEEAVELTKAQSGDRLIEFEPSELPNDLPPKTWALLQFRLKPPAARSLYANKLHCYDGDDLRILKILQTLAVKSLMARDGDWTRDVVVIKRAYAKGVICEAYLNFDFVRTQHTQSIPIGVARNIAENASQYPAFLVAVAEGKCREEAAKRVIAVAKIAEEEGWFRH